jgi:hypothetical protein
LGAQYYLFAFNDGLNPIVRRGVFYIPPSNLEALACIDKAWRECPKGAHPILVGYLNLNLQAPYMEREETIAEQVDAMDLVDMSRHFRHHSLGEKAPGEVDRADEEGGEMDLLSVRLLLREGNQL